MGCTPICSLPRYVIGVVPPFRFQIMVEGVPLFVHYRIAVEGVYPHIFDRITVVDGIVYPHMFT